MFSRRILSLIVALSFISQTLVVVDTDSYSSVVVEDYSILEELSEQDGARGGDGAIELVWDSPGSGMPESIISMGDYLLYEDRDTDGCDGGSYGCGSELFRSDGTAEGSGPLKDINLGKNSSIPRGLTEVNGIAYFEADNGTTGKELWRSDGTADGTFLVKDINPDGDSRPLYLTALGDELLFKADDGTHGQELWKSDGTAEGTVLVKDIIIGEGTSYLLGQSNKHADLLGEGQGFVTFEDSIYFKANNGTSGDANRTGNELWRSDGTSEGTYLVKDIGLGNYGGLQGDLRILGNHIYFPANDGRGNGTELWRSDGTAEGTVMVKDIHSGGSGLSSRPMTLVDNNLFFFALDGTGGPYDYELWKTDGTEGGTVKVSSDAITSGGHSPVAVGDIFYFMADDGTYGKELWRSDGTENGTFMVKDLRSGSDDGCCGGHPYLVPTGDILYFGGYNETEGGWRMHQTDGTSNGTFPVAGADGIGPPSDFTYMDNSLFFRASCLVSPCAGVNLHKIGNITPILPSYKLYKDVEMNPITFDYDGENATWQISPDLPSNLSLANGIITGTPDELSDLTDYTIYANGSVNKTYKIRIQSVPYPDTDGDGVCDGASAVSGICTAGPDAFPFDAAASVDTDGDGMPDTLNGNSTSEPPLVEDLDDDNDGLLDLDEIANGTEPLNPDTDGDGYCDGSVTVGSCIAGDVFPLDENEWLDTDGDGTGNNADTDDDNDGLDDTTEASSDPVTNSTNPDTDGDGVCDGSVNVTINDAQICIGGPDELPTDPDETIDTDGDGIGNNGDTDDDNDGLSDDEENGIGTDPLDPDTDGDFYCDGPIVVTGCAGSDDAFPLDDSEWLDTDGDGIGNNVDPDDDGDSYTDIFENDNGYDPLDGCDPNLNSSACDQDKDGLNNGEEITLGTNVTNPDTDGDGFCDGDLGVEGICVAGPDDFPLDPAAYLDTDGDGMPDTINGTSTSEPVLIEDLDDDNDGLLDLDEIANGTESLNPDSDGDGYCDGSVTVGSCIAGDVFPLDENEWFDTDGDEIGNNADFDDDNDGYNDTIEISEGSDPLNITSTPLDTDDDKIPDSIDADDDNDGYNDTVDAFPTNVTEWLDTDDDGTGNNADFDDDGDGYNDTMELSEGSDPLDSESIPLDTDGDKIPDSTDTDDDNDGYNDTVDAFPTTSAEWLDTDDDGTGDNADLDDDGDTLSDVEEIAKGTDPLLVDTDADTIPDNLDPSPTDPNGDFDGDGILDRDEYNPDVDGNPADADGDGQNDMLQALASESNTSSSDRSPAELCCWALLLLLLLLFPLGKRRYDRSLIYQPNEIHYVIGDNESKIRAVPSLHEYTKKYLNIVNKDGLKDITYGISGNLNELEIDSKTGIVSGHPEKVGKYTYEVVMKHSKGKYIGELIINVTIKDEKVEKPEESESVILSSNPEPENTSSKPKFKGGSGTKMDPFVITPAKGIPAGDEIASKQVITISGLKSGRIVNMSDLEISQNSKRFAIVAEPDEVGRQSALVADEDGQIKFRVNFKDDKPSTDGADYESLIKLGTASVYLSWAVEITKEESEKEPLSKEQKKEKELERIKARSEKIDFEVLGKATSSKLSKPVEMDTSEIELEDASEFEKAGTATITDVDGSEIITWTSKKGNALVGIAGLTRAFVAASIVVAKDDLKIIKGIGPFIEEKLNALGIYMFVQIARMTPDLEEEVNVAIEFFPGRVKRDEWVKQANQLAK